MTNTITLPRSVVEQALDALDEMHCSNSTEVAENAYLVAVGALRAALEQPQPDTGIPASVPAGWKLVPVEPTEAMLDAAFSISPDADVAYQRMLAAAPQPPVVEQEPVAIVLSSRKGNDTSTIDKALPDGTKLYTQPQPQVEQEPVAWADEIIEYLHAQHDTEGIEELDSGDALIRLDGAIAAVEEVEQRYTRPQPRQPLTDDEIRDLFQDQKALPRLKKFVRVIEAAHGIGGEE